MLEYMGKGLEFLGEGGWSTWEWLDCLGKWGWSTWECREVRVPGEGDWSTWERGVRVPGRGRL